MQAINSEAPAELEELREVPPSETVQGSPDLPRTRPEAVIIALGLTVVYALIGYFTITDGHIVQFGSLERLADAYMVWWNDPPKLAAIGFDLAPVYTLFLLPLTLVKPLATSLVALPLVTSAAAGGTVAGLNTLLTRCEIGRGMRYILLALLACNPMFVFYAANGSPAALGLFLAAAAVLYLITWRIMDETRFLVLAGGAMGIAVLVDYTYLAWALALMLAIAFVGPGPKAGQAKLRSSLLLFLTPAVYTVLVWTILNGVILDSPFHWVETGTVQLAPNLNPNVAQAPASLDTALGDLAEIVLGVAPLAFLALPLLLASAIGRRDTMSYGLATLLVVAAAAIVGGALIQDRAEIVSLSAALPVAIAAIAGAAWLYRAETSWRAVVGAAMLIGLVAAIPLSWNAMRNYEHQELAEAFTRYVEDRDSQEGTRSIGGYTVGIDPELAMADYIDNRLDAEPNSILTDSSVTYGVILLTGKPDLFIDRADLEEGEWLDLRDQPGREVKYMLVADGPQDDLIGTHYPGLAQGTEPGLVPIFHTDRYVLVQVGGTVPAGTEDQVQTQPRLVTPPQPLELPRPGSVEAEDSSPEAGLSPLPGEGADDGDGAGEAGFNSAPEVSGE